MRQARITSDDEAVYHICNRVHNKEHIFEEQVVADQFVELTRRYAQFCGVDLLCHCVMDNHIHLFIRIPAWLLADQQVDDAELVRRYRYLYPKPTRSCPVDADRLALILAAGGEVAQQWRQRLIRRMHDLSEFMRELKSRFVSWFNRLKDRCGSLWSDRFHSALVERSVGSLLEVFSYVELNAVRAGATSKIRHYEKCSCAQVLSGDPDALRGWTTLLELCGIETDDPITYLCELLAEASTHEKEDKAHLSREDAEDCFELPRGTLARNGNGHRPAKEPPFRPGCRILGSRGFVQRHLEQLRDILGYKREHAPLPFAAHRDLFQMTRSHYEP